MIQKIISLFIVLVFFSSFGYGAIPASERAALIALYNSTNGDGWYNNSGWKTAPLYTDGFAMPGTEGNWHGIYLDGDHVTNISLYKNQLTGSLPAELGNLFYIGYMNIGDNPYLSGPIPPEMGNLVNLTYLNLHDMDLTGTIPPQLGNLTKLQYFDTGDNDKLYGLIPPELGNLVNLTYLNLHDNDLEGPLPAEFGNLTQLQELHLNDNDISGNIPPQLGNLVNLVTLNLNYNEFSNIPTELGNLTKLKVLRLYSNQLTGEIPASIMNLTQLSTLDLSANCLYCTNPTVRAWLNDRDAYWGYTQNKCGTTTPLITVTSPNGGENWAGGSVKNITWTSAGAVHNVKIEYSTDNGASWNEIVSNYHNDWFYSWPVPNISSANCLIRVSDNYTGGTPSDVSDAVFTLYKTISAPFGEFSTPIDGSTVSSSIAVTGWALDNIEVSKIEIFNGDTYIGDATFVEGARPDIEAAYPTYPNNDRAGWGYMLLTNFLPNGGNGTYTLYARATDAEGNLVVLGAKTITCDNAHAVKPFGAIDTPAQGGTVSGKKFVNWGWVLTPLPNYIAVGGNTIDVWVDGKNKGHPTYNLNRPDIAALFPGYSNSNGAGGYFYLDTTAYANGIHTICWSATDNAGNSDGIGSRFFSIQNTGGDVEKLGDRGQESGGREKHQGESLSSPVFDPGASISDYYVPVQVKKGFSENIKAVEISPDDTGIIYIEGRELERMEINLNSLVPGYFTGYMVVGDELRALPIGSTLDTGKGIFYWQPGPGFIGEYHFVFIEEENSGMMNRKDVIINIMAGY